MSSSALYGTLTPQQHLETAIACARLEYPDQKLSLFVAVGPETTVFPVTRRKRAKA